MEYAHHCPMCSWHRPAASATVLKPKCPRCGGVLRALPADQLERAQREDAATSAVMPRGDGTAAIALLLTGTWLLPLLGVHIGDFAFAPAFVLCAFAGGRAAARARTDRRWTGLWAAGAASGFLAASASGLAAASAVLDGRVDVIVFYIGALASAALATAGAIVFVRSCANVRWERLVDSVLLGLVVSAASAYLLVIPGFREGDPALTVIVLLDG